MTELIRNYGAKTDAFGTQGDQNDLAGSRTRLTFPDSYYIACAHDLTGR